MIRFSTLCLAVLVALGVTASLDVAQRRIEHPGKTTIVFVSMWAVGEPMQQAYERIFRRFERRYPAYRVEARWEGRLALPAIRPRLLTRSDVPDLLNTDLESLQILVEEGYIEPLDRLLSSLPHPDEEGQVLARSLDARLLQRCRFAAGRAKAATYFIPAGVWLHLVFYNQLHYRRLGLEVPRGWAELLDNCRRLKQAGIAPFASDGYSYAEQWPEIMLPRAVGLATLRATIAGRGPRFDVDARYRAVFEEIRELHQPGWYLPGWQGSRWPAAQRRWIKGEATHMINGSWLLRETLAYNPDPNVVKVGAFPVPHGEGASGGSDFVAYAEMPGYALIRGGRSRAAALALLRFLLRRASASALARIGREIPSVIGADFPPGLEALRPHLKSARPLLTDSIRSYGPRWHKFVFRELYHDFFLYEDPRHERHLSIAALLRRLQRRTEQHRDRVGER